MKDNVTIKIAKYIEKEKIPISQIVKHTHISSQKLIVNTDKVLTAEEMFELCVYLRIKPESLLCCEDE